MNKFLINFRAEFDVTNNNKLFGSHLSSSYNHVLLGKTSRLYQIRCLTSRNTAAILRMYFKNALFHCLSHSWQARSRAQIGFDQISPSASSTRDLGTSLTARVQFLTLPAAKNLTSICRSNFWTTRRLNVRVRIRWFGTPKRTNFQLVENWI